VRQLSSRRQRTLCRAAEVRGVGYLTGANVTLRFLPAPPDTGVVFVRTDLSPRCQIAARLENVTGTNRRTTLGTMPRCVGLVEHVLAALAGLRIDNCCVELNAPEPPGLDGSSLAYVRTLHEAGACVQPADRQVWAADVPIQVSDGRATLAIHPPRRDELRVSYHLDYGPFSPIVPQRHTCPVSPERFANCLASSRTYLLEEEAAELLRQGIGRRTRVTDLVVFGKDGPIDNRLRFADEPARHKTLDIVGDLALLGFDLRGHVVAYRSGHPHNAALAKKVQQEVQRLHQPIRHAA
jgi:UDP-3-O-acyl N-acetylglucosamine deacetylase